MTRFPAIAYHDGNEQENVVISTTVPTLWGLNAAQGVLVTTAKVSVEWR
jgi:hypothetical protein